MTEVRRRGCTCAAGRTPFLSLPSHSPAAKRFPRKGEQAAFGPTEEEDQRQGPGTGAPGALSGVASFASTQQVETPRADSKSHSGGRA